MLHRSGGFTILELTVVLMISAIMLGFAALTFGGYVRRTSAQRAAQVFARDLTMARSSALRAREPVVIRFYESSLWYSVTLEDSGTELTRRRFGTSGDVNLSAIDLETKGDSVLFTSRGMASLKGGNGSVGSATFSAGTVTYKVSFNAMGASKVEEN